MEAFAIFGTADIVLFTVAYLTLPESIALLISRGRHTEARALAERYSVQSAESGVAAQDTPLEGERRDPGVTTLWAPGFVSAPGAAVRTLVISAREDLRIAGETRQVLEPAQVAADV
jgi:hypothetical protein